MKKNTAFRRISTLTATRNRLGLTQEEFAEQLGVSRSMIGMAECRQRTLPTETLVKLAALEITMAGNTTEGVIDKPHPAELEESCLNEHSTSMTYLKEKSCRAEAELLQCRLTVMESKYRQHRGCVDQLEKLVGQPTSGFAPGWLETHHYRALCKLNKCSLVAQANLRHKIALLHAAATLHQSVGEKYGGDGNG